MIKFVASAIGAIGFLVLVFGWGVVQWIECRDMGHSILYCLQHIG